jgi:hypothetical protein
MAKSHSSHPGMALGGIFLSLFGATWLAGACYLYLGAGPAASAAILAVVVGAIGIAGCSLATFRARRRVYAGTPDPAGGKRIRRSLMQVNAAQWSLIGLVILVMNASGHAEWIMPGVVFLVGMHFFPLARIFGYRGYDLTAACLVLVAVLDSLTSGAHAALTLFATGAILWASAIALLRAVRHAPADRGATMHVS